MKKMVFSLLIAAAAVFSALAQTTVADMSESDRTRLERAITLMDNGMPETALEILNNLDKEYPDNFNVLYEMCYAYWIMEEREKVLAICKHLENHPAANFQVYHIAGNCLDEMGRPDDAVKTYQRGLKRFPDAGLLYLEQGMIAQNQEDYENAVQLYEKAIEVEPSQPAPYYRLALLYAMSYEPFWAIMYGEAARLLCLNVEAYHGRSAEMSELLYELYKENISFSTEGDSTVIHTTLTKNYSITLTQDSTLYLLPLPIAFEQGMLLGLAPEKEFSLQSLINARGRFIDLIYEELNDYYDVSILDFQHQVRENGHWQAYNMFLLCHGDTAAYKQWVASDPTAEAQTDAFAEWYLEHPFTPTVETPTLRPMAYKIINLGVPSHDEVNNAQDCRKHSDDALRLARWYLDQPLDTTSFLQEKVRHFLFTWSMNSDEIMVELRDCCVADSSEGMVAMMFALIEYGLEHKKKDLGEEGFAYAVKRALAYLDKNRNVVDVPERAEECLKMTPAQLDQRIHEDYNVPVETREVLQP